MGTFVSTIVLKVKGNQVKIGIHAPRPLLVHGKEIYVPIGK
ncbi:carbon storage regulator [Microbulbifer sp. A4B17]|nr:carbon storage regulator [Microbulbifer sp. A4B17]AWF81642.1 carbon storage regulator [Microbulbifer sp. A4B17]